MPRTLSLKKKYNELTIFIEKNKVAIIIESLVDDGCESITFFDENAETVKSFFRDE